MGERGPAPKRSDRRLGHQSKAAKEATTKAQSEHAVVVPAADPDWHPVAAQWFGSLAGSGQSAFYESSDWSTAYVIAESMSREFKPQPVMIGHGEFAERVMVSLPPKGASLAAWLKGMSTLMVTEGDRRRAALELQRPTPDVEVAGVSYLDDVRRRVQQSG